VNDCKALYPKKLEDSSSVVFGKAAGNGLRCDEEPEFPGPGRLELLKTPNVESEADDSEDIDEEVELNCETGSFIGEGTTTALEEATVVLEEAPEALGAALTAALLGEAALEPTGVALEGGGGRLGTLDAALAAAETAAALAALVAALRPVPATTILGEALGGGASFGTGLAT
jgi:hypothetical protein